MFALLIVALCLCSLLFFSVAVHNSSTDGDDDATPFLTPPLWSTYRPNLYFGLRARHPHSPLFGLLHTAPLSSHPFIAQQKQQQPLWLTRHDQLRHDAEERDGVSKYGYTRHNAVNFAQQHILDGLQYVNLTTEQLNDGEGVIVRVSGAAIPNSEKRDEQSDVSLFWYIALSQVSQSISLLTPHSKFGIKQSTASVLINHVDKQLSSSGELWFRANVSDSTQHPTFTTYLHDKRQRNASQSHIRYCSLRAPQSWDVKTIVRQALIQSLNQQFQLQQKSGDKGDLIGLLPNTLDDNANLIIFQHVLRTPFTIDLLISHHNNSLTACDFEERVEERSRDFDQRFEQVFQLHSKHIDNQSTLFTANQIAAGKAMLANLIGGIGYFYGGARVKYGKQAEQWSREYELLSAVPTRSFFPRGFLWDEGFHQLILSHFNLQLSLSILDSWLALIDDNGWLAREQILGEEARKRVPEPFQLQRDTIANPPTLILTLARIVNRIHNNSKQQQSAVVEVLQRHWQRLLKHADWYFATQSAHLHKKSRQTGASYSLESATTFRWSGRSVDHCLASGLDDAPRADFIVNQQRDCQNVTQDRGCEGHVDLHSWMIALTRSMSQLAQFLYQHTHQTIYQQLAQQYQAKSIQLYSKLRPLHWSVEHSSYCDYIYRRGDLEHICHAGYISLFPFLLAHIPSDSTDLQHVLNMMSDKAGLLSEYGLRSLSFQSSLFGVGEDYWRGHIWINLNYLAIVALKHYIQDTMPNGPSNGSEQPIDSSLLSHTTPLPPSSHPSPTENQYLHQRLTSLYHQLRHSLIRNVINEYNRRGFFYEQYHAVTGRGRKSQAFTGWTALTLLMMAEAY